MANEFKRKGADLTTTSTEIYAAPSDGQAVVHSVFVSNTGQDSTELVYIEVEDVATNTFTVIHGIPVPANSTLILDKPINLESDDKLKVWCLSGTLTVYMSIMEVK